MKIIFCCLSFLVASFAFAGQPYCLKDFLNDGIQKCVDFSKLSTESLCLKDNGAAEKPTRGWTAAILKTKVGPDQCVSKLVTENSATLMLETDVVKQTGNNICGLNDNVPEQCDIGGGDSFLCSPNGTVYGRAICVNKTSCNKADLGVNTISESSCQFLDPCRTSEGKLITLDVDTDRPRYCYQGGQYVIGEPSNACNFGVVPACKGKLGCTSNGTCGKCSADTECTGIGTGICDASKGTCTGCKGNQDCPGTNSQNTKVCSTRTCHDCDASHPCTIGFTCTDGDCISPPPAVAATPAGGAPCLTVTVTGGGNCPADPVCNNGVCAAACTGVTACSTAVIAGGTCGAGVCQPPA